MATFSRTFVTGAAVVAAGLAALAALGLVRVDDTRAALASGAPDASDWRVQVADFSVRHPRLVLPEQLPGDVRSVTALLVDGQPAVDVFPDGGPSVTVCSGVVDRCRQALPDNPVVRTATVRGIEVVVSVNPTQDPQRPVELGDAAAFWASVALDTTAPQWLRPGPTPD